MSRVMGARPDTPPQGAARLLNVVVYALKQLVPSMIALYVNRELIIRLGISSYGLVGFALAIASLATLLSAALSDAASRFVSISLAKGDDTGASSYLTNTLCVVTGLALASSAAGFIGAWVVPGEMPSAFLAAMILFTGISGLSGVLNSANFARERFVSLSIATIVAKVLYAVACVLLLRFTRAGIWSICAATAVSNLLLLALSHRFLRKLLPKVRTALELVSLREMRHVGRYVGWMLLTYGGMYLARVVANASARSSVSTEACGEFVLAFNIGLILTLLLQSVTSVTSPDMYRQLAVGNYRQASVNVEAFWFYCLAAGVGVAQVLSLEGEGLLRLWLGDRAPRGFGPLLIAAVLSAIVLALETPINVFLAGGAKERAVGISSLVQGGLIAVASIGLVRLPHGLVLVTLLPAVVGGARTFGWFPLTYRGEFIPSGARSYGVAVVTLVCAAGISRALHWLVVGVVAGDGFVAVFVRSAAAGIVPLALLAAALVRRRSPGGVASRGAAEGLALQ